MLSSQSALLGEPSLIQTAIPPLISEDAKTSKSPSPSTSTVNTSSAPLNEPSIVYSVQLAPPGVPSFTHHDTSSPSFATATTSIHPSLSISAVCTDRAPSKSPSIIVSVQLSLLGVPSFAHQETSSPVSAAATTSTSPSLSISLAYTATAPEKSPSIVYLVKLFAPVGDPSFLYHNTSLASFDTVTTSMSPSASISTAYTDAQSSQDPSITTSVQPAPSGDPSLIHHSKSSEPVPELAITSKSPSLSTSATATDNALARSPSITTSVHPAPAGDPSLINQETSSSFPEDTATISRSPSPSISACTTSPAASKLDPATTSVQAEIPLAVWELLAAPSFSYQAIVSSFFDAETTSISPSLSISATKTDVALSALVAISVAVQVGFAAPSLSYQAMASSDLDAERISISPSLSTSAAKTDWGPSALVATTAAVQDGSAAPSFSCQ